MIRNLKLIEGRPELDRRKIGLAFKQFAERLRVLKSQLKSNFANGKRSCRKFFFCLFNDLVVNVLLCVLTGKGFQNSTQIVGRTIKKSGNILYGWQAFVDNIVISKIVIKDFFQFVQDLVSRYFTGKKLTHIKSV